MDLRFVAPDLRGLDALTGEVLGCGVFSDERPLRGVAGLVDWRLATRLSRYVRLGLITGERGEVVLTPGKPRMVFEKVLLFGLGPRDGFDEQAFMGAMDRILLTLDELRVRVAVIERPGRLLDRVDVLRAAELILRASESHPDQDVWTLVETAHHQKQLAAYLAEERRRRRQL